ncbi:hypothetical protein CDD83_7908 [Cordyceps sp. RAO-2017]|nr:hypothetical protein CDD83_7908 [Cordyceps sp. RAO-2017]
MPGIVQKQSEMASRVAALFDADSAQRRRIPRIYAKTHIERRFMAIDATDAAFDRAAPTRRRMELFMEHALPLAADVAGRALAEGGIADPAGQIGLLVLVTSTGLGAPGIDAALVKRLGLAPSVARLSVNLMGCAAAVNGLRVASDFARSNPGARALVCNVELSSVNAVFVDDINDVVTSSLFADGCSAMVVGALAPGRAPSPGNIVIRHHFTRLVDGTLDGIRLAVGEMGITCELSPDLPSYIHLGLASAVDEALAAVGLSRSDIRLWAIHPGGPRIIEASVRSLGLAPEQASHSWDALADCGNMLSASLPFVLQRMVAAEKSSEVVGNGVAFSFAPGITVEGLVFEVARSSC